MADNQTSTSILCKDCENLTKGFAPECAMYQEKLRCWKDVGEHPVKCEPCYNQSVIHSRQQ